MYVLKKVGGHIDQISINRFQLKWICMTAMFVNHLGVFMRFRWTNFWWVNFYKGIGFIVFPILLVLLLEGFERTSNIKKYIFRLFIAFVVSIIPYRLMFPDVHPFGNVMWTLLICLVTLKIDKPLYYGLGYILTFLSDWGTFAIPMMLLIKKIGAPLTFLIVGNVYLSVYIFTNQQEVLSLVGFGLANLLLSWYNGIEVKNKRFNQLFYWFYSCHLVIIWWLTHHF